MSQSAPVFFTSGDMIADRRYEYARDYAEQGDHSAAFDLLLQALERGPGFVSAWFLYGELRERHGQNDMAIEAYTQALAHDPDDRHGAALRLARLGVRRPGAAMSPAYVCSLFDQYAPRFDKALADDLAYRGPKLLFDALFEACTDIGRERWFERALDLGCGTGLAGEAFWTRVDTLHGVDLSPEMAKLARRRGCYSDVQVGDMLDYLRARGNDAACLIIAADSLVYVEDLAPLFTEAARVLEQHGLFACTVETHSGQGVVLGEKLRYAHAADHVRAVAQAVGLVLVVLREASTRNEGGVPVPGLLMVAEQRLRPLPPVDE